MNLLDLLVTIKTKDEATPAIEGLQGKAGVLGMAIGSTLGNLASQGIQMAAGAIVDFGKESIETGMQFDKAMSQVAATMGLTTADIGDLTACAKEMGASTSYSATEAAQGLNFMALAGYSSEEAIKTLPTVLNLAAAGDMELARASDMVTDAQTALGLELDDVTGLVDQMAKTSSKSNTSVAQLGDAILTVGGTAKNLSGGVTEMNTVLGLLADNGIKGAEAGTHLRNMILSLTAPTDVAAKKMAELGISATDAEGNMRPLEDVMQDFNEAFKDMTAEEKTQALNKIFNKTDLAAVNALLDTSVERWDELGAAIEDSAGSAEKMAQTQLDNLAGDMTLLQSATEGVQIELAAGATPALREMVQTGTEGLSKMASQLQAGDLVGGFETLGQTVSNVATVFFNALPQFVDAGVKMLAGFIKGFGEGLPQLMPALVQCITQIAVVLVQNIPLLIEAAAQMMIGLATGLVNAIPVLIQAIPQLIQAIVTALVQSAAQLIVAGVQLFIALVQAIPQVIPALIEALPQIIDAIVNGLIEAAPALIEAGIQLIMAIAEGMSQVEEFLSPVIEMIVQFFATMVQDIWNLLLEIVANVATWVGEMAAAAVELGAQFVDAIITFIAELPGNIAGFLAEIIGNVASWVGEMITNAQQAGSEFLNNVVNFVSQLPGQIANFLSNIISNVVSWVSQMISNAQQMGSQFLSNIVNFFSQLPGQIANFCANVLSNIASWASNMISKAVEMGSQFLSTVQAKFGEVVSFFMSLPSKIIGAIGDAGSMLLNVGRQIIQGLISGITSMVGNAISAVTNAVSGIVNAAKSFLGIHSPSRVFAEIGDFSMQGLAKGFEEGSEGAADILEDVLDDMSSNSVEIGVKGAAGRATERSFVFNVTINNTGDALSEGRRLGEALYTEYARLERRTA